MEIVYKHPTDLNPNPNNARTHSDEQITFLAASIKEFGFNTPIIVDNFNMVLAGHARLRAAVKLGLQEVPTVAASSLDEHQKRAFMLSDNRLSEISEWDEEALAIELEALKHLEIDVGRFGFDMVLKDATDIKEHNTGNPADKSFFDKSKDEYDSKDVKTIYLFFDDETGEDFLIKCERLYDQYKVDNISALMVALIDEPYDKGNAELLKAFNQ